MVSPPTYRPLLSLTVSAALVAQHRLVVLGWMEVKVGCSEAIGAIGLLRISRDREIEKWIEDMECVRGILTSE